MWRNFKIRSKMLIGFALVLTVFGISVTVTWTYLDSIKNGSEFINERVIPAQVLCTDINDEVYELFMAVRLFQINETQEDAAIVKKWMADIQKTMDDISALYAVVPELQSMSHQVNVVFPKIKEYMESITQSLGVILAKNEIYESMTAMGNGMTSVANEFLSTLTEYAQKEAITGAVTANVYVTRLAELDEAGIVAVGLTDVRRVFQSGVIKKDLAALSLALKILDEDIGPKIKALRAKTDIPEHQRTADDLYNKVDTYKEALQAFIAKFKELEDITQKRGDLVATVNEETSNSIDLTQERITTMLGANLQDVYKSINVLFSSACASILFGIGIAFLISRTIAKPLSTIVGLAKRAGDGDLTIKTHDFNYEGRDELGSLVNALSTMVTSQEEALHQVVAVSESLSGSADSLSSISEETNASMEEVKASIDQVSSLSESNGAALQECNAGVEEMSAGADTVAQSATDSAAFISQTTDVSNKAIQTVNKVIQGMHEVDKNARESENKMKQLVASVENVSSFVSVITGIADQTNLLALNAAIEAARAGEVGRGFAVVAEEVRKLAEESAKAAQNVNGIIVDLQSGAKESIKATTEAGRMLGDTLSQAEQAQGELNNALNEMNKANDSIQNIAAVAQEQAASCKEVATAIDNATRSTMEVVETITEIRRAADDTANAAQGVAEQSEAVNDHANNLTEVLSRFKLNSDAKTPDKEKPKALKAR